MAKLEDIVPLEGIREGRPYLAASSWIASVSPVTLVVGSSTVAPKAVSSKTAKLLAIALYRQILHCK